MKNKSNKLKSILALTLGTTFGLASIPAISVGSLFKSSAAERNIPYTSSQKTITNGNFETVGSTLTGWENQRIESLYDLTKNNVNTTISGIVNVSSEENFKESLKSLMGTTNSSNYNTFINQYESFYTNNFSSEPVPTYEMPSYPNKYSSEEEKTTSALMISAGYVQNTESRVYLNGSKLGGSEVPGHVTISPSEVQVDGKNSFPVIGKSFTYTPQSDTSRTQTFTYYENTKLDSTDPKRHCWINNEDSLIYYNDYVNAISENKVYETYTSSSDLQLSNDCYFKLTFRVYTTSRDDEYATENKLSASIKLLGDFKDNENSTFENINTYSASNNKSEWAEYTYYIATNYGTSGVNKTRIQLSLGSADAPSSGTVFFDDVELVEIQQSEFYLESKKSSSPNPDISGGRENIKIIDMKGGKVISLTNFDYPASANNTMEDFGWEWDSSTSATEDAFEIIKESDKTGYSTFYDNDDPSSIEEDFKNHCLKVTNSTSNAIKFNTSKATVEPFNYYKISLWSRYDYNDPDLLKSTSFTHDKFSITLNGTLDGKTVSTKSYDIDPYNENQIKTDSTGHVSNFWVQTSFYVQACPIYQTEIWFTISVPKNSLFLFDNYTIENITSTEYSSATDKNLALTSTLPTETISNGFFFTTESDQTTAGLYSPSDWTLSKGDYSTETIYYLDTTNKDSTHTEKVIKESDLTITTDNDGNPIITYKLDGENEFEYSYLAPPSSEDPSTINYEMYKWTDSTNTNENYSVSTIYVIKGSDIIDGIAVGKDYDNTLGAKTITKNDKSYINPNGDIENYLVLNNTNNIIKPKFTYLSEKFSVSSGKYRAINVYVYSELSADANAKINLLNSSSEVIGTLNIAEHENVANQDNWVKYTFHVLGGIASENLYLQIQYGDGEKNMTGAVLFKTIYSAPSSENVYNEKQLLNATDLESEHAKVVNLSGSNFTEIGEQIEGSVGQFTPLNIEITTAHEDLSVAKLSIVDTTVEGNASFKNEDSASPYVLVMQNTATTRSVARFDREYSIAKSSYYKFTVVAKAIDIPSTGCAQIKFTNLSSTLTVSTNEYTEYTFYLATGTDSITTSCEMILDNCTGTLAIDSISVEKLTESTYTSGIADISTETPNITKIDFRDTTETDDDAELPDAEKSNKTLEVLFATLSSLLLVVALIIAIVFTRLSGKKKRTRGKRNKVQSSDIDEQKGFV